jgi:hypothetical protein
MECNLLIKPKEAICTCSSVMYFFYSGSLFIAPLLGIHSHIPTMPKSKIINEVEPFPMCFFIVLKWLIAPLKIKAYRESQYAL